MTQNISSKTRVKDSDESWFLAQLKPGGLVRARVNLERQGFVCFMPMLPVTTHVRSKLVSTHRPLFPGYLFVSSGDPGICWSKVSSTFGVSRLVSLDGRLPTRVPASCMISIQTACVGENWAPDATHLRENENVRIVTGPLTGSVGKIVSSPANDRIIVLLELMGRQVKATVQPHTLETT